MTEVRTQPYRTVSLLNSSISMQFIIFNFLDEILNGVKIQEIPHRPMGFSRQEMQQWVAMPSSRGSFPPRDRTRVSHIAGRFFTSEPPGKPKNTGVGSLSLL